MCIIIIMRFLKEKNTLKGTIPFTSLMIALNIVFISIASYLPVGGYVFCLFLPLISALYCLNTKFKYYPIYFICSLGLGIAATFQDFSMALLYLLPALLQGLIFSVCIKHKVDGVLAYFYSSIILFICTVAVIPLVDFIYSTNTINNFLKIFNIDTIKEMSYFILAIIYLISCAEVFIVYLVTEEELQKLGYKMIIYPSSSLQLIIVTALFGILTIIFWIIKIENLAFLFLAASLVASLLLTIKLSKRGGVIANVAIFSSLATSWIVYVFMIDYFGLLISFLIIVIYPLAISMFALVYYINDNATKSNKEGDTL